MEYENLLIGLSQIGMIFAGLISVFIIFEAREGKFPPHERMHISGLVLSCIALLICSLTPFVFFVYGFQDQILWRASASVGIFGCICTSYFGLTPYLRLSPEERKLNGYFHAATVFAAAGAILVVFVLAAIGKAPAGNYITGTLLIVAIGLSSFGTFAHKRFVKA